MQSSSQHGFRMFPTGSPRIPAGTFSLRGGGSGRGMIAPPVPWCPENQGRHFVFWSLRSLDPRSELSLLLCCV